MPRLSRPTPNLHVVPPPATPKPRRVPDTPLDRFKDAFLMAGAALLYLFVAFVVILPVLFLLEVYLAFRLGGIHIVIVLFTVAVLLVFGTVAGWIETWRNASAPRPGKHVHVYHHRDRW